MPQQGQQSSSSVQFFPGQKEQAARIFAPGGLFDQLLSGKPNAGFERAQRVGLQQLANRQASSGIYGQPIGERSQLDFLSRTTQASGDNFISQIQSFMQPAGSQSSSQSSGILGGPLGFRK